MNELIEQHISWDNIGNHEKKEYIYSLGKAVISKDTQVLTVNMKLNFIVPHGDLECLKKEIQSKVPDISDVKFSFDYSDMILTDEEVISLYIPYLIEKANGEFALITRTILPNKFVLSDGELTLYTLGDIVATKLNESVASLFEEILLEEMSLKVKICFRNHEEEYEKAKAEKIAQEEIELIEIQKSENAKPASVNKTADGTKFQHHVEKNNFKNSRRGNVMKPVKGEAIQISDIVPDSGTVIIEGELYKKDSKTIKNGKKLVLLFVTDKATSICVKTFLTDEKWEELNGHFNVGDFVRIQGESEFDLFENMTILMLKAIEKGEKKVREDNAPERRVELHAHTKMSAMDGLNEVESMIKLAASWKHKAVAITDHGVVQAFPEAANVVRNNKLDIKVIYGVEAYFFDDTNHINDDGSIDYKTPETNHIIILAQTQRGLKNLYKLISVSHLEYFYKRPRIPKSILHAHREGLLIGSACEGGEIYSAVLKKEEQAKIEKLVEFYDYLEIQPLINNNFMIPKGIVKDAEELKENNRKIVALGEKLGKPVVATCDTHYTSKEESLYRNILMAGQGYKDVGGDGLYFRTTEEMLEEFDYLGKEKAYEVVVNTPNMIADMIEDVKPVPAERYSPKIENADEKLRTKCMQKAYEIYGNPLPEDIASRLERELASIINNGYAVMYVSAEMLVQKSLDDGYLVGSRGSVGSSFAATMAGITEVNPLPAHYICAECKYFEWGDGEKYECGVDMDEKDCPKCGRLMNQDGFMIPFETFLGFEGDKEPDIDLNFAGIYQPQAHKYVEEIFGKNNVFRAGTISTIASKTAYGFVKNYFDGLEGLAGKAELGNERKESANKWEIDRLAIGCSGVRKTTGQHPGGVIIVPDGHEIYEFCPVQRPANDTSTEIVTTHFDYHAIEKNLLKLDILGHDVPSMIRHLQDLTGVDPLSLPLKDEKVNSIFNGTDGLSIKDPNYRHKHGSYGIPEFGTRFVRQMLDDTKPSKFADLVKISGCSHGTNVWINNAHDYIRDGIATMDEIISTRDDIMRYLILKGLPNKVAFKIMESVRRGKGVSEEDAELMRENNVPDWYIDSCRKIEYMFPRAHAVAYVMMSYRIAYYKVYYPAEFYAVYFTTKISSFDAETILKGSAEVLSKISSIEIKGKTAKAKEEDELTVLEVAYEMYSRGLEFLPARLETSKAMEFDVTDGKVLLPFCALMGLGETVGKAIAEEYARKPFDTIEEIKERTKANKTAIEALREHGALEGLPEADQLSLF